MISDRTEGVRRASWSAQGRTVLLLCASGAGGAAQGVLKKGAPFPTELPKSQLRSAVLARMLPQMQLTRGAPNLASPHPICKLPSLRESALVHVGTPMAPSAPLVPTTALG